MIQAVKVKNPSHPYISFLNDFIDVISKQDNLIKIQYDNVKTNWKVSLIYGAKANKKERDLIAANKIILSLEEKVKELEAVNERLKSVL